MMGNGLSFVGLSGRILYSHISLICLNHNQFCLCLGGACIRCCRSPGLIAFNRFVVSRRKPNEVVERLIIWAERSRCSVQCERCQKGSAFPLLSLSHSHSPKLPRKKDCRETEAVGVEQRPQYTNTSRHETILSPKPTTLVNQVDEIMQQLKAGQVRGLSKQSEIQAVLQPQP
jgi:hypothetical protein